MARQPKQPLLPVAYDEGRTVIDVVLGASIRVERGWGVSGELAGSPIRFNGSSGPIAIPTGMSPTGICKVALFVGSGQGKVLTFARTTRGAPLGL